LGKPCQVSFQGLRALHAEQVNEVVDTSPNISSRILGHQLGLTAIETNMLLKDQGFLDGEPGAWGTTEKAMPIVHVKDIHLGTGGYDHYNRYWSETTWDPSIKKHLDLSDVQLQKAREAARARRAEVKATRESQAVAIDGGTPDQISTDESGVDLRLMAVGVVVVGAAVFGIVKVAPKIKALWIDKVTPRLEERKNRKSGDGEADPET